MRKPNAILHMMNYGFIYGWLLGALYSWLVSVFLSDLSGLSFTEILGGILPTLYISFIFGALPGGFMGIMGGFILWGFTRNIAPPITPEIFGFRRNFSIAIISTLTMFGMWIVLAPFVPFLEVDGLLTFILTLIPTLIAGGASAYSVNRFMLKLRAWGGGIEKAKNKAKHTPKNKLDYEEDNLSENALNLPDADRQSRMEQD